MGMLWASMQVMVFYLWPYMIDNGKMTPQILTIVLATFLAQYIPKLYHITLLIKRLQDVTGYIFVSAWGGFAVNVTAFFICAHVSDSILSLCFQRYSLMLIKIFGTRCVTF